MNKFEHSGDVMITISGPEVEDGAKADVRTTDRQYEKNTIKFSKIFKCDSNESLQSFSPSLTGFDIQASVTKKNVTLESRESP